MIRLGLMRHGHTHWNRAGQIQGLTDIPIDDEARAGLAKLCLPPGWEHARVVASPLARAMETGEIVTGQSPEAIPALIEMNWGAWEGRKGADLRADPNTGFRDIDAWGWDYRPPDGESPAEVRARLLPWVATLDRDCIAICHIGIMRVLMAHATGWNFYGPAPFQIKRNRLFVVEITGKTWRVGPVERLKER
ncbi:MAG: histidine phosphatase family protein [Pseudomonadota bacterium]